MPTVRAHTFTTPLSPRLSERCRMVVRMRIEKGKTQEEIAELLGVTQPMVWKYLARARKEHPNLPRLV